MTERTAKARWRPTPLQGVLAFAFLLFLAGIWWGLPSFRGWAPDEVVPSRVFVGLRQLFSGGWYDIYPPFHYYILGVLYSPFYLLHQLHVIDLGTLPWYTALFYIGRLLSVAMATATIYLVYKCGREILDERSSLIAALISALAVPYAYYAKLANFDTPYIFWFALSLFFFLRILKTHEAKYYWLFTAAAVLAVCSKDQAYALFVLAPPAILLSDWRYKRASNPRLSLARAVLEKRYLFLALVGAGLFLLGDNVIFNRAGFIEHVKLIIGPASQGYQAFPRTPAGEIGVLWQTLGNLRYAFGWPLVLACAAGVVWAALKPKRNPRLLTLLVFVVSYHVFYSAVILYNYDRFNLPACLVLALFGGRALSEAWERTRKFAVPRAVAAGLLLFYSFAYAASVDVLMAADGRYKVERWMKRNIAADAVIGAAAPTEYCPRLDGYRWFLLSPTIPTLAQSSPKPDFVLYPTLLGRSYPEGTPERRFFDALEAGKLGYVRVLKYQAKLGWLPLDTAGAATNIVAVNPEIQIYKKIPVASGSPR